MEKTKLQPSGLVADALGETKKLECLEGQGPDPEKVVLRLSIIKARPTQGALCRGTQERRGGRKEGERGREEGGREGGRKEGERESKSLNAHGFLFYVHPTQ